jgi:hypothetical protein
MEGAMMKFVRRMVQLGLLALVALAIWDQLTRDPEYRTWHGQVFGVPYDFRKPTLEKIEAAVWSPDNPQLLGPHVFGVGWTPNIGRIYALLDANLRG